MLQALREQQRQRASQVGSDAQELQQGSATPPNEAAGTHSSTHCDGTSAGGAGETEVTAMAQSGEAGAWEAWEADGGWGGPAAAAGAARRSAPPHKLPLAASGAGEGTRGARQG